MHGVELRVATSRAVLARWPDPGSALTAAERARVEAFGSSSAADDFVAAHLLARECVTALTGARGAEIAQHCQTCGGSHGKPTVVGAPDIGLSWSHSHGTVAAAADHAPVGVDVEARARHHDVTRLLDRTATPAEASRVLASEDPELAYLRMWVAKEALVKIGALRLGGFGDVDVSSGRYGGAVLSVRERADCVVGIARRP